MPSGSYVSIKGINSPVTIEDPEDAHGCGDGDEQPQAAEHQHHRDLQQHRHPRRGHLQRQRDRIWSYSLYLRIFSAFSASAVQIKVLAACMAYK